MNATYVTNAGEAEKFRRDVGQREGAALNPLPFIIKMDVIWDDNGGDTPWSSAESIGCNAVTIRFISGNT